MSQFTNKMDFEELLTPYVQGKLDSVTRKHVEEHARNNTEFYEKLQFELQLESSIKYSAENFAEFTPSFHKLKQSIEAEPRKSNKLNSFWINILSFKNNVNFSWFRPGMALASMAMISLGAYMLFSQQADNSLVEDYETLSSTDKVIVYQKGKQYLRVVIATKLAQAKLDELQEEYNFTVEKGPDSLNSYVISVDAKKPLSKQVLNSWRKDTRFQFVEPLITTDSEYY